MRKTTKLMKSTRRMLGVLVLIVLALILATILLGGRVARMAIARAGAKTFGTDVNIAAAKLSVLGGSLRLDGITVDNPAGYRQKACLELQRGDMQVKPAGLFGGALTIRALTFDGLNVIVEPNATGSNVQDIIESLRRAPSFGKQLYVDRLEITNITVTLAVLPSAGRIGMIPIKLPPITMTNLGRDEYLDTRKLAHKILTALAVDATHPNVEDLPKQVVSGVLDTVVGLGKTLIGATNDANHP